MGGDGDGTGVVDVAIIAVGAAVVRGGKQGWMRTAAAEAKPHYREMHEEKDVREQYEAPSECNQNGIRECPLSSFRPRLIESLLTNSLLYTSENGNNRDERHSIGREEKVPLDKSAREPFATGDAGDNEIDRAKHYKAEKTVERKDFETVTRHRELT